MIQDTAIKFISDNNGKSLEAEDMTALDQCMDEIFKYLDVLGIDRAAIRHPYAYQVWSQATDLTRKYFDLFPNTPTFVPQVGDIAICGKDGDKDGNGSTINGIPVGHIDLVAPGTTLNDLVSFAQNWDTLHYYHLDSNGNHIPYCRIIVHYKYYGVVGFLRPKITLPNFDIELDRIKAIINGGGTSQDKIKQISVIINS